MTYRPNMHQRRSVRLKGYDYSRCGAYFITICTRSRENLFGDIRGGTMILNDAGAFVSTSWEWLAERYPYVELDAFVVMPNHVHGILMLVDQEGGSRTAPTGRKPLGGLIGAFKTVSAKGIGEITGRAGTGVWQRNYYEHIIRNDAALARLRKYVATNPDRWPEDTLHPDNRSLPLPRIR